MDTQQHGYIFAGWRKNSIIQSVDPLGAPFEQMLEAPELPHTFAGASPLSARAHSTPAWQNSPNQLELRARLKGPSPSHSRRVPLEPPDMFDYGRGGAKGKAGNVARRGGGGGHVDDEVDIPLT